MDLLGGSEAGGLKQAVCVYLCVCCVCKQWPWHAVPLHGKPCQDKAEQGRFLLVLGRSRPLHSGVTQLRLLRCGCPVQALSHDWRQGRALGHLQDSAPVHSGTDPLAAVPAKLRGWQPHLCAHRPDTAVLGVPSPRAAPCRGGLQPGSLQSKQGSRWHSRLAVSQLLMTLPAINEGVADAGRSPCLWYLSPWWSSAPKSPGH